MGEKETMRDILEEQARDPTRRLDPAQKCDRCGGTGTVHGMAEDEWGACCASWPCERGCKPKGAKP